MTFRALADSLGGRPFPGSEDYYHIAELTLAQIRAHTGTAGTIQHIANGDGVRLHFPVADGIAVIVAAVDQSDVLRDADLFLIKHA